MNWMFAEKGLTAAQQFIYMALMGELMYVIDNTKENANDETTPNQPGFLKGLPFFIAKPLSRLNQHQSVCALDQATAAMMCEAEHPQNATLEAAALAPFDVLLFGLKSEVGESELDYFRMLALLAYWGATERELDQKGHHPRTPSPSSNDFSDWKALVERIREEFVPDDNGPIKGVENPEFVYFNLEQHEQSIPSDPESEAIAYEAICERIDRYTREVPALLRENLVAAAERLFISPQLFEQLVAVANDMTSAEQAQQ